ncbi:MAG: PIN domain-containing protein [Promethearchaeota archaeon]
MKFNINLVIIDSNFILLPFQFKIDYFSEIRQLLEGPIRFVIFQQILDELESKKKKNSKAMNFSRFLEAGVLFIKKNENKYDIKILEDVKEEIETTDDFLIRMCFKLKEEFQKLHLATNDSNLRRKAKKLNINTIFLRQKKYLSID